MPYETIIYEVDRGIATLTFNRPQVMNAQNEQQAMETRAAMQEANEDDDVRVLFVTGAGRGFHAGDDVKAIFLSDDEGCTPGAESRETGCVQGDVRAPKPRGLHGNDRVVVERDRRPY
jgi:2-(1,2-epoxy-1,2-dihydrophenyl)acetyl-CoA isomerase